MRLGALVLLLVLLACGGGSGADSAVAAPAPTAQETQCSALGWQRVLVDVAGVQRVLLWKAPAGPWTRGAIVVLHGGGGQHANFCVANVALTAPQVRFTELALAQGFAVFLPDSSDRVTDHEGRLCGKVWDDEVRSRANLDLPFIEQLLTTTLAGLRPPASRSELFLTGLSSGGFMSVRAATRLADRVTAFAPVSSGDPYGWFRDCTPRATDRSNVFGVAFDSETVRQITEPGACSGTSLANEKPWDGAALAARPAWRVFHDARDAIVDESCVAKLRAQLVAHGYPQVTPLRLEGTGRAVDWHFWQDAYNQPMLDFFVSRLR